MSVNSWNEMKLLIFLFAVCAVQLPECKSFNLGKLFGFKFDPSSPTAAYTPFNKLKAEEQKKENAFLPLEEILRSESNESDAIFQNFTDQSTLDSSIENIDLVTNSSANEVLNNSNVETEIGILLTNNEKLLTTSSAISIVSSTEDSRSTNLTFSRNETISSITEEPEGVVLGTEPSSFTIMTKKIYQKTIDWMGDTYTLSILVPIAAGVLFALSIIFTVATWKCIRKKCRRKFRRRVLPDTIKNLRPSDQARLLGDCGDSSDEF